MTRYGAAELAVTEPARHELPAKPRVVALRVDLDKLVTPASLGFEREPLEEPSEEPSVVEMRDNSVEGDWARQEDYELVATWRQFSVAFNNHLLVRNYADAQIVASFSLEY